MFTNMTTTVYVYGDWETLKKSTLIGSLRSDTDMLKNKEHFSFNYDDSWLMSSYAQKVDPDLKLYSGYQHSADEKNFRIFLDSCPDRWGRLLMNRREAIKARQENRKAGPLNEIPQSS